jgi:hypothetical protein
MQIDGDIDGRRKLPLRSANFEESLPDAIELVVDGVRREVSQVVQQRFCEGIPSSGRDVHVLVAIQLERLSTCICELLIEGDPREDFLDALERMAKRISIV